MLLMSLSLPLRCISLLDSGKVLKGVMNGSNTGEPYLAEEIQATEVFIILCINWFFLSRALNHLNNFC